MLGFWDFPKMTQPIENLVTRQSDNKFLNDLLINFSVGIEEAVNFGSHILKWDLEYSNGGDEQLPIELSFRHFLELIDAISVLVKHSSIDPSKLLLRGALESYFGLEYILKKDTFNRSMAFMVCHVHKNLKFYKKLDISSEQGQQFQAILNNDKTVGGMTIPKELQINAAISNLESLLLRPEYQNAEQEFIRLKNLKIKNPPWYRLFNGPKTIQGLAEELEMSALYEVLYRYWSGPVHGVDIIQGKISALKDNSTGIVQIRYPKDAQSVTAYAVTLSLKVFSAFIKHRIPHKSKEYQEWYKTQREFYIKVTRNEQLLKVE